MVVFKIMTHIWNNGLGSSGYGYMASQWPRMEPVFGVSSKLTFYMEHVLQRAIAILLPSLQDGFFGEKGLGGLQTLFLLSFFSPSINQPQCLFPFLWCDCIGQLLPIPEGKVTSPLLLSNFIPAAETWGFCARGSSLVSLTCANLCGGRAEKCGTQGAGGVRMTCPGHDVPAVSASQVCHTFLEIGKVQLESRLVRLSPSKCVGMTGIMLSTFVIDPALLCDKTQ